MTDRIKVLHLIDSLASAGAERLLVDYVACLQELHPEINQYICTLKELDNELPVPDGVIRINGGVTKWNFPIGAMKIDKFIAEHEINIVHAHLLDSILLSRLFSSSSIKKKIFTYHNLYFDAKFVYYSRWRAIAERLSYKTKYISIYVSDEVKNCVEPVRRENGSGLVLNNFPNPAFHFAYQVKNTNEVKAVMVANLRKTKNLDLAIEELRLLKDYPVSIDIYGEGPLRKQLEEKIKTAKVKVTLKGSQIISSALLSKYDVFLMTSESEGFPVSLLEAMTTGLPSILPDHLPVFQKVAKDCSYFYSIRKPGQLAEILKKVLHNKETLAGLSMVAGEKAKLYRVENYVKSLMELYKR